MTGNITGRNEPEVLIIPKIRRSSLKFDILDILAQNEDLSSEDLVEITGKKLNNIRSTLSSLRKDGLVYIFQDWNIRLTPAGVWYIKEYDVLESVLWEKQRR